MGTSPSGGGGMGGGDLMKSDVAYCQFSHGTKGWLVIAKLKPLSLFISLLSMPKKAFDNVKIEK